MYEVCLKSAQNLSEVVYVESEVKDLKSEVSPKSEVESLSEGRLKSVQLSHDYEICPMSKVLCPKSDLWRPNSEL